MTGQAPADPPRFQGPWCTLCGHAAQSHLATLDPRRPIGLCLRGHPDKKGCGRVIASYDLSEADYAYKARRRKATESRHRQHPADNPGKYANWCGKCSEAQLTASHTGTTTVGTKPTGARGR